jgi:hypothetical protein
MKQRDPKDTLKELGKNWPSSLVARTEIRKFTGGAISEKRLANLDSLGLGPSDRLRIGKKVCYPVSSLIEWLAARAEALN